MAHTIHIEVNASLRDWQLIHRILNFKEDIHRELIRTQSASITDPRAVDLALEPLTVVISGKRYLGPVSTIIARALKRYDVAESVVIRR